MLGASDTDRNKPKTYVKESWIQYVATATISSLLFGKTVIGGWIRRQKWSRTSLSLWQAHFARRRSLRVACILNSLSGQVRLPGETHNHAGAMRSGSPLPSSSSSEGATRTTRARSRTDKSSSSVVTALVTHEHNEDWSYMFSC